MKKGSVIKRVNLFKWINDNHIDIALLQETYCVQECASKFSKQWNGSIYHSHSNSKHARGFCILLDTKFKGTVQSVSCDNEGRKILLNIKCDDSEYTIANVYCPTDQRERVKFLSDCIERVNSNKTVSSSLILECDMNCVQWPSDRSSKKVDITSESLRDLKRSLNVKDAWKMLYPDSVDFTYIDPSFRHANSRLDILCI